MVFVIYRNILMVLKEGKKVLNLLIIIFRRFLHKRDYLSQDIFHNWSFNVVCDKVLKSVTEALIVTTNNR